MDSLDKVSVIIPTYNRFSYLLNAINSIKKQTYSNIEIIVVNDCSTQKEYYEHDWSHIKIIHLEKNTRELFGFACAAYVRNQGIETATGKYVAFCDDDDSWLPKKLELQLKAIKKTGCKMSSTDGFVGYGVYNNKISYKKYNAENCYNTLQNIYRCRGSLLLDNGFPEIWSLDFLKIHNCMICSSVIIEKDVLDKINNFKIMPPPGEDYDCWLRSLEFTNSVYISDACFYYDDGHGDGRNY